MFAAPRSPVICGQVSASLRRLTSPFRFRVQRGQGGPV
jgi:hypothetical protein